MELDDQIEFAAPLTEEQVYAKLCEQMVDGMFTMDFHAKTVLWFDEEEQQHCVNQFFVVGSEVEIGPMPIMTFTKGSL